MSVLNLDKFVISLYFPGNIFSHTTGPKYLSECLPMYSVLTLGIIKVLSFCPRLTSKRQLISSLLCPYLTLNISMATRWMFRWWMVTDPFFFNRSNDSIDFQLNKSWFKKPTFQGVLPNSVYNNIFIVLQRENRENRENRKIKINLKTWNNESYS